LIHCEYTSNKWLRLQLKLFKQICSQLRVLLGFRSVQMTPPFFQDGTTSHNNGYLVHSSCISLVQVRQRC
jgi:hypothetical protein